MYRDSQVNPLGTGSGPEGGCMAFLFDKYVVCAGPVSCFPFKYFF